VGEEEGGGEGGGGEEGGEVGGGGDGGEGGGGLSEMLLREAQSVLQRLVQHRYLNGLGMGLWGLGFRG
jgi:hypothetical protein